MKISLLVNSRKRCESLKRMWDSALGTATYPKRLELILYVDDDDVDTQNCYNTSIKDDKTKILIGPRKKIIAECTNLAYYHSSGEIIMLCTDDVIFHTHGWDRLVFEAFLEHPDRIVMVYGEDDIQHGSIATLPFVHSNWVKVVGYFIPPYFVNEFGDMWVSDVAKMIGRKKYIPHMRIQHLSPHKGTMEADQTFTERAAMSAAVRPWKKWMEYYHSLLAKRKEDAEKLQSFILGFPKS